MSTVDGAQALQHSVAGTDHEGSGGRFSDMTTPAEDEITAPLGFHKLV